MCVEAVKNALKGVSGVIGNDEEKKGAPLRAIEFPRIKGGKAFDTKHKWFGQMLKEIGQPMGKHVEVKH
jgi:pyrophosphate--fructose-6-phosphate 1-phosphotransferase